MAFHQPGREKGVGAHLPERPGGFFAQMSPDPFFPESRKATKPPVGIVVCHCFERSTLVLLIAVALGPSSSASAGTVSGELRQWHRVTITVDGPATSESAA